MIQSRSSFLSSGESAKSQPDSEEWWLRANEAFLNGSVDCLRLCLHRKMLWVEHRWRDDVAVGCRGSAISRIQALSSLKADRTTEEEEDSFYRESPEAQALGRRIAEAESELKAIEARLSGGFGPSALSRIAVLFGLSDFERWTLLLLAATQLDPEIARACAYIQDDPALGFVTPSLALGLFREGRDSLACRLSLMSGAPLRRYRIVRLEAFGSYPWPLQPLRADERILDYLLGVNRLDEKIATRLRQLPETRIYPSQQRILEAHLNSDQQSSGQRAGGAARLLLNLFGPSGDLPSAARFICERRGLRPFSLDTRGLEAEDPDELCGLLEREARLSSLAYFLDLSGDVTGAAAGAGAGSGAGAGVGAPTSGTVFGSWPGWLLRLIERSQVPLVLASGQPLGFFADAIGLPPSTPLDRSTALRAALGEGFESEIDPVAFQFELDCIQIDEAAKVAGRSAGTGGSSIWEACRLLARRRIEGLSRRIESGFSFEDLVLPADVKESLHEIARQVKLRHLVLGEWGFGERLVQSPGVSAIFSGPSGTGKTMAAGVLAGELSLDLYRVDLALIVNKYIGETEKNLKRIFDAAEASGAILFFDEADALFGKRTDVKDSHDRYANVEINYLLQRMEEYRGLAILATNRKSDLDRAFLRRLRFQVDFPFPDSSGRLRIWQRSFPAGAPVGEIDWEALSRLEISGGNIRNIALNAAFLAAHDGANIEMRHLFHAAKREYAKMDRMQAI